MCKSAPLIFALAFITPKLFMDGNMLYGTVGLIALVIYFAWSVIELIRMEREMKQMRREMLESLNNMMTEIEKRRKKVTKKEPVLENASK
jgi:hypothetical protein